MMISPALLATNSIADVHQISEVREIITELQTQIDAIETEIMDVKTKVRRKSVRLRALRALRAKQRAVRKTLFLYAGLVSPMRAVPPEILSRVFVHCLPPSGTYICTGDAPLLLMKVCRRWRDVALSTPRLWTSLAIGIEEEEEDRAGADSDVMPFGWDPVRVADMWLKNSGALPLDIDLCIPGWVLNIARNTRDVNQDVMAMLTRNVHRWRNFKATLSVHTLHVSFPSDVLMNAPTLESFNVSHPGDRLYIQSGPLPEPAAPRIEAPRLSTLSLRTDTITPRSFTSSFGSTRLLAFWSSSTSFPLDECLDLLTQCPLLEYLDVMLDTQDQVNTAPPRPRTISLPHLDTMYIHCHDPLDTLPLLQSLHTPQLCVLEVLQSKITLHIGTCAEFWSALEALIACSSPPLRELCLTMPSTAPVILPVLRRLQDLEILDFQIYAPSPDTLEALTPVRGGSWLCPRLSALYLVNVVYPLWGKGVIELVKARMPEGDGVWDGESRPTVSSDNAQVVQGRYLTELGVWNANGIGLEEEQALLELGEKGGERTMFTVQQHERLEDGDPMVRRPIVSGKLFRAGHAML